MSKIKKVIDEFYSDTNVESLSEMANFNSQRTGISKGIIRVSSKECSHVSRIKYYPNGTNNAQPSISASISNNPVVLVGDISLVDSKTLQQVFKWVIKNNIRLQYFWDNGTEIEDTIDYLSKLQKI